MWHVIYSSTLSSCETLNTVASFNPAGCCEFTFSAISWMRRWTILAVVGISWLDSLFIWQAIKQSISALLECLFNVFAVSEWLSTFCNALGNLICLLQYHVFVFSYKIFLFICLLLSIVSTTLCHCASDYHPVFQILPMLARVPISLATCCFSYMYCTDEFSKTQTRPIFLCVLSFYHTFWLYYLYC